MLWSYAAAWDATVTPEGENRPHCRPYIVIVQVILNLAGVQGTEDGHILSYCYSQSTYLKEET